jgi:aldehyde dehydrogenase family 7 protein A1
MFAMNEEKARW